MSDASTNPGQQPEPQGSQEASAAAPAAGASPVSAAAPEPQQTEKATTIGHEPAVTAPRVEPTAEAATPSSVEDPAAAQPVDSTATATSEPPAGAVPPPPTVPVPPAPQPKQPKPTYAKGCLSAAWDDIKATPGWFKKVLFLGLVGCVPILNFVMYGYILNWVREVPFGGRTAMPREVVTGRNFEVGFYYFVISLVFSLVVGIVSLPISFVPLLGSFASIALSLFVEMFVALCSVRMALSKQLGEGFNIAAAWRALKADWTALLVAVVVPGLLAGLAMMAVGMLVVALAIIASLPVMAASAAGASGTASLIGALTASAPFAIAMVLLVLALVYVCMVVSAGVVLLTFRAAAHYIGRYAPQWANEAKVAMGYPV